jgi:endonuclease/exonuclease/phosphatase family metal-dependent hydrolase
MEFVVCSYNVRHRMLDDGRDAWARRRDAVTGLLRSFSPDVLGLQESTGTQQRDIERALDRYRWHGVADDPGSGEHNPIGAGGRFVPRAKRTEWLSPTPDEQSVGWDAAYPRVLTRVLLTDTLTDRSLAVYNTHFDHRGRVARRHSARLVRERITSLPAATEAVVLGDFNCRPGTRPYEILLGNECERPLRDTRTAAATTDGPATTVTDFEALDPGRRLDHVLVTPGLSVDTYRAHDRTVNGRYPSDHLPIVARLRFD